MNTFPRATASFKLYTVFFQCDSLKNPGNVVFAAPEREKESDIEIEIVELLE